jgi:hypothetical protein
MTKSHVYKAIIGGAGDIFTIVLKDIHGQWNTGVLKESSK